MNPEKVGEEEIIRMAMFGNGSKGIKRICNYQSLEKIMEKQFK